MSNYCEDYPACGHTPLDPCARQPYDEPGYYDTSIKGNEHALCDHENGECDVEEYDEDDEEGLDMNPNVMPQFLDDGTGRGYYV